MNDVLALVDVVQIYDNSSHAEPFTSIAFIDHDELQIQQQPLPDWAKVILVNYW
ncbi:MAG: hypothetical protein L3J98_07155 [Gammaproteobacteria bacterium]|nr:hypothetical protein [Gammaproteobacteria bacterium]MCF6259924.1 hypothetical protein [Gammaproteobacteria bacterium]